MKWKAKIRQGLLIEEWVIKAYGNLSNLNHIEFIAKNGGIIRELVIYHISQVV